MKKILVLGGTMFIGRAFVEKIKGLPGYDITLFNRGQSNTSLFGDVKQIHGNRETDDIKKICSEYWDCIIDFSGYYPDSFQKLLTLLEGRVGRYIFISTLSVYDLQNLSTRILTEEDKTLECTEAQKTSKLPDAYGEKKAEMERILLQQTWLDKIIFRPSFIYGKYDWTDRFYYWLYRVQFSNKILMPDGGTPFKLSITNSDDLAQGLLQAITLPKHRSVYNAVSQTSITLREMISLVAKALNKSVEIISPNNLVLENGGLHNSNYPLFVPFDIQASDENWQNDFPFQRADISIR